MEAYSSCFNSLINTCNKIYPLQLSKPEVQKLKDFLLDPAYQYWPISSIALHALKTNILPLSINTWYKYA
jgi:hypothetical protein